MRKLFALLAIVVPLTACSDKITSFDNLPSSARTFINEYFDEADVTRVKMERDMFESTTYEVRLNDGTSIDFNNNGKWTEVDCLLNPLPNGIVPSEIAAYITENYPDAFAREISRGKNNWEVSLNNGLDLKFNSKFQIIEIDD